MAIVAIPNNTIWEYDNDPADPGINSPLRKQWLKQTNGIATDSGGHQVYVSCRKVDEVYANGQPYMRGGLSKTFIDNQ